MINFYITKKRATIYFPTFLSSILTRQISTKSTLSAPDEYGFGQVEKFDKYNFNLPNHKNIKNSAIIGLS